MAGLTAFLLKEQFLSGNLRADNINSMECAREIEVPYAFIITAREDSTQRPRSENY